MPDRPDLPPGTPLAIETRGLGKLYKLYQRPADRFLDIFGGKRLFFWRKDYYQEFWALRGLDLAIHKGERLGIIGRNGAGKSTLLKVISGTLAPTEGVCRVTGQARAIIELGTGFHPEFNGRENIQVLLTYQGYTPAEIRAKEEEIVDFAELEDFIDQPVKTYSAGMYARLAFAIATSVEPDILIVDEVLSVGDAYFVGKSIERMRRLTETTGTTLLFVSHDLGSIQRMADRVIWIDRGRVRMDGEPLDVLKAYAAVIRHEEDLRLKARDLKLLRKQAVTLEADSDLYDRVIFHLVDPAGYPARGRQRIYHLRLWAGADEVGQIEVGQAMDNAAAQLHFLIDTPGFMTWGPPGQDAQGRYREHGPFLGRYRHAPFEFAVPKSYQLHGRELRLEVTYSGDAPAVVEVHGPHGYQPIGQLPPQPLGARELAFAGRLLAPAEVAPALEAAQLALAAETDSSQYGKGGARLGAVQLLDGHGRETRILEVERPLTVVLEYEARERLPHPVFVFCVYLADGRTATQWFADLQPLAPQGVLGRGRVVFTVERLLLGRGAYVASAAIFESLRPDGQEGVSYHVLDRVVHFQVIQPLEDPHDRGLCLQPYAIRLEHDD